MCLLSPGDSLQEEQTLAARAQHSRWMKKLLYRDSSTGPVSEFKCHMARTDTFQDLLKDKPKKYSLRKPGMLLKVQYFSSDLLQDGLAEVFSTKLQQRSVVGTV